MARYLLVAHQTADSPELKATVLDLARGDPQAEFVLLVPATPLSYLRELEERASTSRISQARRRALRARELLGEAGVSLAAARIGAADPLIAIQDELRSTSYRTVVICTFPPGLSRWLRMDLPAQLARRHPDLEVRHVVAGRRHAPGPEGPEQPPPGPSTSPSPPSRD